MKITLGRIFNLNSKKYTYLLVRSSNNVLYINECYHSTTTPRNNGTHYTRRYLNIGGKASSTLLLSPAEATRILRTNESTVDIEAKSSIKYYDNNYLGANNPPEDRYAQAKFLHSDIYLFGVFDGHGGYQCSDTITQRLYDYIGLNFLTTKQLEDKLKWNTSSSDPSKNGYPLWKAFSSPYGDFRSEKLKEIHKASLNLYADELLRERIMEESIGNEIEFNIEKILKQAFLKLDQDIKVEAMPNPANGKLLDKETMSVAMSGSCACVALLNGKNLYVANCGDARAVMGQENDDGTYTPYQMSREHNAENEEEVKRLFRDHPNEHTTLIRDGRLLEMLLPFRAFGDVRFKWGAKILKEYTVPLYGHGVVPPHYLTPPYLSAEPEIIHKRLNYKDKFLVLATDGLWDLLTPERVIQLIGNHLNGQQSYDPYLLPEDKPIKLREVFEDLTKRRVSISLQPVDHNSATHLIRYALGNDHIQLSNYLRADTPRTIRDDITITVVYFDTDHIIGLHE